MNLRVFSTITTLAFFTLVSQSIFAELGQPSRSFLVDLDNLQIAKEQWLAGDVITTRDVNRVISYAEDYLDAGPFSVVYSELVAPSGDPHDYVSYGAYLWPDPESPDGTPWILRDGHVNPANVADFRYVQDLSRTTQALSYAYFFTGDERYAEKTADLIRTFFLDEETFMNPRNPYSQLDAGETIGDYEVVGFANRFPNIFDAAGIIESSAAWTRSDKEGLQQWTRDLVAWAESTRQGELQFLSPANHGTNYDFLHGLFAIYSEDLDKAQETIEYYFESRLPLQMDADGSNPLEMLRANNLLYHRYNLGRAFDTAALTRVFTDFDGFDFQLDDGRSLRLGLDYLLPYFTGESTWDAWPESDEGEPGVAFPTEPAMYYYMLRQAAVYYQDPELLAIADSMPFTSYGFINLTHPRAAVRVPGDINGDRIISAADIDLLAIAINQQLNAPLYDLNEDGRVDQEDRHYWIDVVAQISPGDADLNGHFDSQDLVAVFQNGNYEDAVLGNGTWATGYWNGDLDFDSRDFVYAFQFGEYVSAITIVPEPHQGLVAIRCLFGLAWFGFHRRTPQKRHVS